MAHIISKYEGESHKAAADFDVLQLLDKYGPITDDEDETIELNTSLFPDEGIAVPAKRRREDAPGQNDEESLKRQHAATGADSQNYGRHEQNLHAPNVQSPVTLPALPQEVGSAEPPFVIEPGPAFYNEGDHSHSNAYDAMLQFYQLVDNSTTRSADQAAADAPEASAFQTGAHILQEDPTQCLMNLVDWRASLENFPNPGMEDSSLDAGNFMESAFDDTSFGMDFADESGIP